MNSNNLSYNILIKIPILMMGMIMFCSLSWSNGNERPEISNITFSYTKNGIVIIQYDILNYSENDYFFIALEIFNLKDEKIKATSLSGDINCSVLGGKNKLIMWDLKRDYPDFSDSIYVKVNATVSERVNVLKDMVLLPTLYPGFSLYKFQNKKEAWLLLGLSAYGALGSAVILNQQAMINYNDYKNEWDKNRREDFYENAEFQRRLSNQLFFTGLSIWAVNYGLSVYFLNKKNTQFRPCRNEKLRFSLNPEFLGYTTFNLSLTMKL